MQTPRPLSVIPPLLVATALLASACGSYTSQYQPLADGRARPLWDKNTVRAQLGAPPSRACAAAVTQLIDGERTVDGTRHGPPFVPAAGYGPPARAAWIVTPVFFWFPYPFLPPVLPWYWLASDAGARRLDAFAAALAVALVVLPIVDIALAAAHPENGELSAASLDAVNAYNDLARSTGNPCTQAAWAGGAQ